MVLASKESTEKAKELMLNLSKDLSVAKLKRGELYDTRNTLLKAAGLSVKGRRTLKQKTSRCSRHKVGYGEIRAGGERKLF